ncbi:MAG: DNA polymerase III subunit delta [Gammaproteobacteria bacterium]|nr:DNA polymerase III subunit delta [Gammaproteobacteria bacterium]
MKIKPEQLSRTLTSQDLPLYWLSGDEPLLMIEAADLIRNQYRENGYTEREIFNVDKSFDWGQFLQSTGNLSLFAEKKIIEVRLSSAKLEDAGKKAIQHYLSDLNPDYLLLLSGPKLDAATLKTKWFTEIEKHGAFMQIWPINRENLAPWLKQRLLREGIQADAEAVHLLVDKVEGNLLAAMQEIEKLKLLASGSSENTLQLDAKTVMQVVADSSRYNVYQLIDAALLGDVARAQKMLVGLKNEGVFSLIILAAVCRELRTLLPMLEKKREGQGVNAIIQSARVWFNRKQAVATALARLDAQSVWKLLDHSRLIDQSIKGLSKANPWDELSLLLLHLSGANSGPPSNQHHSSRANTIRS